MILQEELREKLLDNDINGFEIEELLHNFENQAIIFKNDGFNELIRFCKSNNIKNVFYTYEYYYKENYTIDEEEEEDDLGEEIFKLMKEEIKKYNKDMEKIDFSRPTRIIAFTLYEDKYITFIDEDEWLEDIEIYDKDDYIEELEDKYYDKISKIREVEEKKQEKKRRERENRQKDLREEFKQYLFNNSTFKYSTNKEMRVKFGISLYKSEDINKFEDLFLSGDTFDKVEYFDFLELAWREYKDISKSKK